MSTPSLSLIIYSCLLLLIVNAEIHEKRLAGGLIGNNEPTMIIDKPSGSSPARPVSDLPNTVTRIDTTDEKDEPSDSSAAGSVPADGDEIVNMKLSMMDEGNVDMQFSSHGRKHHLELKPSHLQLDKIPITMMGSDETLRGQVKDKMKNIKLMKDSKRGAAVAVQFDDGADPKPVMKSGFYTLGGHQFNIRPHHNESSGQAYVTRKPAVDKTKPFSRDRVIVKRDSSKKRRQRAAAITPITATVELTMIIDYSIYDLIVNADEVTAEGTTDRTVTTLLYFAHMADMINENYQTMKNDDIAITVDLAQLILITSSSEMSHFTEDDKYTSGGSTYVDSSKTLARVRDWYTTDEASSILETETDHLMLFTAYDIYEEDDGSTGTVGLAYTGTICDSDGYSSSIVEIGYLMSYDASTAAHELGHSLGAHHDGQEGSSEACSDNNYVMAAYSGNDEYLKNRFLFGCCSQRSFYGTLSDDGACLQSDDPDGTVVSNTVQQSVINFLPGQIFSADDQCYLDGQTAACGDWVYSQTNSSICLNLWCVHPTTAGSCIQAYTAAADGTECDNGKYCYQGKCITENQVYSQLDQHCDVSDCYGDELQCTDGSNTAAPAYVNCYPPSFQCDGVPDCSDGSDEDGNCEEVYCPSGYTRCRAGTSLYELPDGVPRTCVYDSWICDGSDDCTDGSDETNCDGECYLCSNSACVATETECKNNCTQEESDCMRWLNSSPQRSLSLLLLTLTLTLLTTLLCYT